MLMKLYRESTLDPLTGLINRRVLMKRLEKEILAESDFYILMFVFHQYKQIKEISIFGQYTNGENFCQNHSFRENRRSIIMLF